MQVQIYLVALTAILGVRGEGEVLAPSLPPPSNVSIACDSYRVEVHWQYPHHIQNVLFQLKVNSNAGTESCITSDRSFNISDMLKSPAFSNYVVYLTAIRGNQTSHHVISDIFSFNEHATSKIKCYLDFPEVTLSAAEGKLHLEFPNPLHLYRNTPALRNNTDILSYFAETEEHNELKNVCGVEFKTCRTSIAFAEEREEYCVNLTGKIGQRPLKEMRKCFYGDLKSYPHFTTYLYPVLGVVFMLLFITFIIMLLAKSCNAKIKKKAASAFPKFLVIEPKQTPKTLKMEPENVARDLQIKPVTCEKEPTELTTLIEISADENESSKCSSSTICPDHYSEDAEDGEQPSGYDCPHALRQEMSPGDLVEVYRL